MPQSELFYVSKTTPRETGGMVSLWWRIDGVVVWTTGHLKHLRRIKMADILQTTCSNFLKEKMVEISLKFVRMVQLTIS